VSRIEHGDEMGVGERLGCSFKKIAIKGLEFSNCTIGSGATVTIRTVKAPRGNLGRGFVRRLIKEKNVCSRSVAV